MENNENARLVTDVTLNNIRDVIKCFEEAKLREETICLDFEGKRLYSIDTIEDVAFAQVYGLPVEENLPNEKREKTLEEIALEQERRNATQENKHFFGSTEAAINYLLQCKKEGKNIWIELGGYKLYSCDADMDKMFVRICGLTSAQAKSYLADLRNVVTLREQMEVDARYEKKREQNAAENRKEAIPLLDIKYSSLDEAVEHLNMYRREGDNVYIMFGGHPLYSCDELTLDKAYMQVFGLTEIETVDYKEELLNAKSEEERSEINAKYGTLRQKHEEERRMKESFVEKAELKYELNVLEAQKKAEYDRINKKYTKETPQNTLSERE